MNRREKIAKVIYEETSSYFIVEKTPWEDTADFVKKEFLDTADKINDVLLGADE